jgi:translation initiation factor 5B
MRDKKTKFKSVKEVNAAAGVKIICPLEEQILSGMAFETCSKDSIDEVSKKLQEQVSDIFINTDSEGIIAKADSIGGLEALVKLLKGHDIKIRKASIGNITKKDIIDAESSSNKFLQVILGFNVSLDGNPDKAKIITSDIIYRIIENYEDWIKDVKKEIEEKEVNKLIRPSKIEILQNCIFRQSNPCIFGVEVLSGEIKTGTHLMNKNGDRLSSIKSINIQKESVSSAEKGKQVAISCQGITAGRQINENDILYSSIPESDFRELKRLKKYLSNDEISTLKEIVEIKRRKNPVWGI